MFVFGHVGIGRALAGRWKREHSLWWLALGTLLPDLIDKPLYYARLSDFFSCTRTVGHTTLLVLLVFAAGRVLAWRPATTVAIGMTTHLILDCLMDVIGGDHIRQGAAIVAAAWPLLGPFAQIRFVSIPEHLEQLLTVPIIGSEIAGLSLLIWEWSRSATRTGVARP